MIVGPIFSLVISFCVSFSMVPVLQKLALKWKILDIPDGIVKQQEKPVPYLGGIAVYIGFIASLAVFLPFKNNMISFLVGATLLLFIGLVDDLIALNPLKKVMGQLVAVFCFLKAGFYLKHHLFSHFWMIPLSGLWMLTLINAFNLIDIMDGLAATVGICSCLGFLSFAFYFNLYSVVVFLFSLLGALFGFFVYNKRPAKIYLGDSGALFLGGVFSVLPFFFEWTKCNTHGYFSPVILLALPLFEVVTLITLRTIKKIPFYYASKDHFAHYLQQKGFTVNKILTFVVFFIGISFISAFFVALHQIPLCLLVAFLFLTFIFWLLFLVCS